MTYSQFQIIQIEAKSFLAYHNLKPTSLSFFYEAATGDGKITCEGQVIEVSPALIYHGLGYLILEFLFRLYIVASMSNQDQDISATEWAEIQARIAVLRYARKLSQSQGTDLWISEACACLERSTLVEAMGLLWEMVGDTPKKDGTF